MKKLKLSELNLGNIQVLTREQLKKIKGGQSSDPGGGGDLNQCVVKTKDANGNNAGTYTLTWPAGTGCEYQSTKTSEYATAHIPDGGSARYDCGCDGWGV